MTLRTRWTNWRAKVHLRKLRKEHSRVEKRAKEKHDSGLLEAWEGEHAWEFEVIDLQLKENLSRDVLDRARELYVPTPSLNDKSKWLSDEEFLHTGAQYWILTPAAMMELNDAIRKEKRARREDLEWRLKIVGGFVTIVTGLVGAAIGLVAIWKK